MAEPTDSMDSMQGPEYSESPGNLEMRSEKRALRGTNVAQLYDYGRSSDKSEVRNRELISR
jgi:hypothetical protein